MPLLVVSPNIQDGAESPSRKRSHEEYLDDSTGKSNVHVVQDVENISVIPSEGRTSPTLPSIPADSPPSGSPESLLTDVGTSTPARPSPSPNPTPSRAGPLTTPQLVITIDSTMPSGLSASPNAQGATSTPPPAKRKRLTPAEKEEKAKADAARREEKAKADTARKEEKEKAEAARKLERAAAEAEKKARAEEREREREEKRKRKEEEDRRRTEEKDKKRKEKEEEERKIQKAKEKKERSQLRLNSFFKTGAPSTPKKASPFAEAAAAAAAAAGSPASAGNSPVKASPQKAAVSGVSEYDRIFKPFFIKENVIMATTLYGLDDEAKSAKSRTLDDYVSGKRGSFTPAKLDASTAVDYFQLPCRQPRRGRTRPSVRKIMTLMSESGDAQDTQTKLALNLLRTVPMKFLGFREDVRPAYYGTATNLPTDARLPKLARNPMAKTVVPLNYDYDSEAEWVDDGDGEDVDDLDDEEEDLDEDEEMDDFLDDSEDAAPIRAAFTTGMEPESTGICWEDQGRPASGLDLDAFRMEFILEHDEAIDPFSTQYWEPVPVAEPAPAPTTATSKATASKETTSTNVMAPPPAPTDAFAALGTASASVTNSKPDPKKAGVAPELVDDFKKAIMQYAKLSKIGVVEILSSEFPKCTKSQIKNSLEALAERTGPGQQKTWKLK